MRKLESWELIGPAGTAAPAHLARACALVGHDLLADAAARARLPEPQWWVGRDDEAPAGFVVVGLESQAETRFGVGLDATTAGADLVARVAEIVQDHFTGYEFITWPTCPGHGHPMTPGVGQSDTAWWFCPATDRPVAQVGRLASC